MSSDVPIALDVDHLLTKLWNVPQKPTQTTVLTGHELHNIICAAKTIIRSQPVFLELLPPLVICGDTHGQFYDLLRIFERCGDPGLTNYLFLGDYVDRGPESVNTISLLLLYKIKYPENFFLLRGNHEASQINLMYGFYDECEQRYPRDNPWKKFNGLFDWLPIAGMIDNRVLCVHGGLSSDLHSLAQLREIRRPLEIPDAGLECDLTWADPEASCDEWEPSPRMTSCIFGERPARKILQSLGLDALFRAHQAIDSGWEFPFEPWNGVVTIFSAPNYGGSFGNYGAVVSMNAELRCRFVIFEPKTVEQIVTTIKRPPGPDQAVPDQEKEEGDLTVRRFGS